MNRRQQTFINEYLVDLNATRAAIAAGYSSKTARAQGARLLTNANIKEEVEKRQCKTAEDLEITRERVIHELVLVGFSSLFDIINIESLNKKEIIINKNITDEQLKALSEVKVGKSGISIKMYDKMKALDLLAKYLGLYNESADVNIHNNLFEALKGCIDENVFIEELET